MYHLFKSVNDIARNSDDIASKMQFTSNQRGKVAERNSYRKVIKFGAELEVLTHRFKLSE